MKIKGCSLDKDCTSYEEVKRRCVIAQGWSGSGDVSFFRYESNFDIYVNLIEGTKPKRNAFPGLFQISAGDIVLAFEGEKISGICEVPKNFEYIYQDYDYSNSIFPVKWIDWKDISNEAAPSGFRPPNPIFNIHQQKICAHVAKYWETYKKEHSLQIQLEELNESLERIQNEMPFKVKESRERYTKLLKIQEMKNRTEKFIELIKSNKNIILTGAPGTGKTYLAKDIAKAMTGADADEKNPKFEFVQFHPSYDYTDFVEGLRPEKTTGQNEIGFSLKSGIFRAFCDNAMKDPLNDYVFVIDEINRGEISKIFGELFFSIDLGYRGSAGKVKTQYANLRGPEDQYFYVPENVYIIGTMNDIDRSVESFDFAMRRRFAWKEITAEESQKMFDYDEVWKDKDGKVVSIKNNEKVSIAILKNRMNNLNNAIVDKKVGLSSSYQIGAAYFLKLGLYLNDIEPYNSLWKNHLCGLLGEYLRGTPKAGENLIILEAAYNEEKIA